VRPVVADGHVVRDALRPAASSIGSPSVATLRVAMPEALPHELERLRFGPERALHDKLFARFGLDVLIDHFVGSGGVRPAYDLVIGSQLRLTPLLAPRLTGLLDEAKIALGFHEPLELFVTQAAEVNASAIHSLGPAVPHVVSLTSALVERMNDDELRFVLGHELGHLSWRHYRARLAVAAFGADADGESKAPPLLVRRLESWDRLAEISADRAGLVVAGGKLEAAVSAFFKIQSGLGPEHLRFDIQAFLDQLTALQQLERRELLARFSHPATPIRVRALDLFRDAEARRVPLDAVDREVDALARLMDYAPSEPLDLHMRDLVLSAGLLVAHAGDHAIEENEWNVLAQLLLPYSADPELEVQRIGSTERAEELLAETAAWLEENAGEERFVALRLIANVAAIDGRYSEAELAVLHRTAALLDVPPKSADAILYEVLADHLQTQAVRGAPVPTLKVDR
jgi:uncharacterized tellurite resistance protein B-like protein